MLTGSFFGNPRKKEGRKHEEKNGDPARILKAPVNTSLTQFLVFRRPPLFTSIGDMLLIVPNCSEHY